MFGKGKEMPSIKSEMEKLESAEDIKKRLKQLYKLRTSSASIENKEPGYGYEFLEDLKLIPALEAQLGELEAKDDGQMEALRHQLESISTESKMLDPRVQDQQEYGSESRRLHKSYNQVSKELKAMESEITG